VYIPEEQSIEFLTAIVAYWRQSPTMDSFVHRGVYLTISPGNYGRPSGVYVTVEGSPPKARFLYEANYLRDVGNCKFLYGRTVPTKRQEILKKAFDKYINQHLPAWREGQFQ
jgi:hypothetical protein